VHLQDTQLEVLYKRVGAAEQVASVKLPFPGHLAVVGNGVGVVALIPDGLAIVDLRDPTRPRYDRTISLGTAIASMRVLNGTLWTVNSQGIVNRVELGGLLSITKAARTAATDSRSSAGTAFQTVTLRNGSRMRVQIIGMVPLKQYTLRLEDGQIITTPYTEIASIGSAIILPSGPANSPQVQAVSKPVMQLDDYERPQPVSNNSSSQNTSVKPEAIVGGILAGVGIVLVLVGAPMLSAGSQSTKESCSGSGGLSFGSDDWHSGSSTMPSSGASSGSCGGLSTLGGIMLTPIGGGTALTGIIFLGYGLHNSGTSPRTSLRLGPAVHRVRSGMALELRW
jgi:hypothetical protein